METIEAIEVLKKELATFRKQNLKIGFVPTMGALHDGHISLIEKAKSTCDVVVVSIFVNPAQFGPKEDLEQYPRNLEIDSKFCKEKGVDVLFAPSALEIYPIVDDELHISYPVLTTRLCGKFRPGHFDGVLLVMTKLLNIVKPDACFMGQKDGQQLILVEKLVKDLDLDVNIVGCPTLRESSGLAMSSRNTYLSKTQRESAETINAALESIVSNYIDNFKSGIANEIARLQSSGLSVQYFELVSRENLNSVNELKPGKYMLCVAVLCSDTRLIDNYFIDVDELGDVKIDRGNRIGTSS